MLTGKLVLEDRTWWRGERETTNEREGERERVGGGYLGLSRF